MNALLQYNGTDRLILITCDGTFNTVTREYDQRFVVHATIVP